MSRIRFLLPLIAALSLLAPAAAHAAAEPGMNLSLPFTPADLANVRDSGSKTARFFMFTSNEPAAFDQSVADLASIGVKPVFVIVGDPNSPSKDGAAINSYAAFVGRAAAHFRGRAAGWEIWNEPDAPKWWAGMPALDEDHPDRDASAYVPLLKASYAAAKQADPATPVVLGGLTGNDYKFVDSVYKNGGGGSFDAVATHTDTGCAIGSPYGYYRDVAGGPISQWAFLGYRSVHDVMAANGDENKPIWLTEMGWSSYTGTCQVGKWAGQKAAGVGEDNQAKFTTQAMHCLSTDPYVTKVLLFRLNEDASPDPMDVAYGAVRTNNQRKPLFNAWQTFAGRGDTLPATEECGDFKGPSVTITQPAEGAVFATSLPIKVSAADEEVMPASVDPITHSGVARISVFADDSKTEIRNFTDKNAPASLDGTIDWQGAKQLPVGTHKLTVLAIDPFGNVGTQTVTVTKVDPSKLKAIKTTLRVKLSGKKAKKTVKVTIVPGAKGLTSLLGKIQLVFQKNVKGKWKTAHKYSKTAKGADVKPAVFTATLKKAKWRGEGGYTAQPRTSHGSPKSSFLQFKG